MDLLFALFNFFSSISQLIISSWLIVLALLCLFNKNVWHAFEALTNEMGRALHVHILRKKQPWKPVNYAGLASFQRIRRCRCGYTKTEVKAEL